MTHKLVTVIMLILTICFLVLGFIFGSTAQKQRGVAVTTGIIVNGEFSATDSGRIGANEEKEEAFHFGSTTFYILAGVTGLICIGSAIYGIRQKSHS